MLHYHVQMGGFRSAKKGIAATSVHYFSVGYTTEEEGMSTVLDWDVDTIRTTIPEAYPNVNEHDCFHYKLRGNVNVSLAGPAYSDDPPELVVTGPGSYALAWTGEGEKPSSFKGTLTITRVETGGSTGLVSLFGVVEGTSKWWSNIRQDYYEQQDHSDFRLLDSRMEQYGTSISDPDELRERVFELCSPYSFQFPDRFFTETLYPKVADQVHPGDVAAAAAKSVRRLDINLLGYIKDIVELPGYAKGLVSLGSDYLKLASNSHNGNLRGVSLARQASKLFGKAFLSSHYGLKLTVSDTTQIADAINRFDPAQAYQHMGAEKQATVDLPAWGTSCTTTTKLTAVIGSYDDEQLYCCESIKESTHQLFSKIARAGYELDALPTASNLWDLVPLSFVVDWFLPIGKYFEKIEYRNYMATLPVKKCFITRRTTFDTTNTDADAEQGVTYTIHHEIYDREYSEILPLPPMRAGTGDGAPITHVIEGAALLTNLL